MRRGLGQIKQVNLTIKEVLKSSFFHEEQGQVPNKNSKAGNGGGSSFERDNCTTCAKQDLGKCLAGTDGCFGYGNNGHKMRYFTVLKKNMDGDRQSS